jgi:hypothetical protein
MDVSDPNLRNRAAWLGPLVAAFGLLSYFTIFYRWPALRDFPWLNLSLLLGGIALSIVGLRRAWPVAGWRRIAAASGMVGSVGLTGLFVWYCFLFSYSLPDEAGALAVGRPVPELVIEDHSGAPFDLARASHQRVVLVFYRGHW